MLSRVTLERILCDCKVSRILTDGRSQVIDVGRATRTVGIALWNALVARDRHCTESGCVRGPGDCEAHHIVHWSKGGPTTLDNLKLLCWEHHRQQHIRDAIREGRPPPQPARFTVNDSRHRRDEGDNPPVQASRLSAVIPTTAPTQSIPRSGPSGQNSTRATARSPAVARARRSEQSVLGCAASRGARRAEMLCLRTKRGGFAMTSFFDLYAPPLTTGDEKALLHLHLRLERDALLWKLESLSEADLRRPMTPTGTNLLGLVKHLTGVEGAYFCDAFGKPRPPLAWESDEDVAMGEFSDMYAKPDETGEEIVASYRAATAAADRSIEELDLNELGRHHLGITVSLRWMLLTVLLDTARHAGHADIVREQIDGAAGSYRQWPGVRPADDVDYRRTYLARVRGEVDDESWYSFLRSRQSTPGT